MFAKKYKRYAVLIIIFLLFIFQGALVQRVGSKYFLYNALNSTAAHYSKAFNKLLVPDGLQKSFLLQLETTENDDIKKITVLNSKSNDYIEFNYNGNINLTAFANNKRAGFYTENNPQVCYTAKTKNFCSKWNESIYGKMIKIPSFVPDDLSYKKINSFLTAKKLIKASVALGIGKVNIKARDIANIISVSDLGTYPMIYENKTVSGRLFRLSASKEDILNFLYKNIISADNSNTGFCCKYVSELCDYLKSMKDKHFNIDVVVYKNKIRSAKIFFDSKSKCISLNTAENGMCFSLSELTNGTNKNIFKISLTENSPNGAMLYISSGKNKILHIKKSEDNTITACFSNAFSVNDGKSYKMVYKPTEINKKINAKGKDMYKLSVLELYTLIKSSVS